MEKINPTIPITILNVNGLNNPMKRWILSEKNKIQVYAVYHFKFKDTNKWKVKGWKKRNHANENHKKAATTMLISNKIDYKAKKNLVSDKEEHFIKIRESIHEEDVTIINILYVITEHQNTSTNNWQKWTEKYTTYNSRKLQYPRSATVKSTYTEDQ